MIENIITVALTSLGVIFFLSGSVGLLRFPTVYCRLHALTKADNLGLGLIAVAQLPQLESASVLVQIVVVWILAMISGAAGAYLLARRIRLQEKK